jgi:hypothetical protein
VCFRSVSCCMTQLRFSFSSQMDGLTFSCRILWYGASRVAQRSKELHISASCVTKDPGLILGCFVGHPGRPMRRSTIGPVSSGFGSRVWPDGMSLSHRTLATPTAGRTHAYWHGCQVYSVSSDTLVQLASGLRVHCVKKQCGWRGCVSEDAWLLTFASP